VLVLLGVLFTIILAGLDNTIVSTVMPVALPELGSAHLYAWTFAAYMLAAAVSLIRKAQRHERCVTISVPRSGPATLATAHALLAAPSALPRLLGG